MSTESVSIKNQRLSARKKLRSYGTLVLDGCVLPFDAIDIGLGGLSLALARQLSLGQRCRIELPLVAIGRRLDVSVATKVTYCVCGRDGFKAGM